MTADSALKNLKQHPDYHHEGGDLTIIIGDTRFRVASVFFVRESPIFEERLKGASKAAGNKATAQQAQKHADTCEVTVKQTIVIEPDEKVTPDDFAQLCSIFFNRKYSVYEKQLHEWKTVLRLATQWKFDEVKELAFRELDHPGKFSIPLVDRIVLYQKYSPPPKYLEPLFEQLLTRPASISEIEGTALGLKLMASICDVREKLIRKFGNKLEAQTLPENVREVVRQAVRQLLSATSAGSASNGKSSSQANGLGDDLKTSTSKKGP